MAAPTYATDLTTMVDFDGTPSSPTVSEPSTGWTAGRSPTAADTDFPIQSSTHASLTMNTTGKAGILCTNVSSFTWTSGDYLFGWIIWLAPGAIATQANGGLAMLAGDGTGAYEVWYVGGSDYGLYPYGGWQNFAVDPEITPDETPGTTPSDYDFVGAGANVLSAVSKGNPLGFDKFTYGRGELRVAVGDSGDPGTFAGMAAANDATAARWGLFQAIEGGYKYKGLMILGYAAAVYFEDSDKSIVIDEQLYVNSDFNAIEIRNASSTVNWTNILISSLNSTSFGSFEVVDNATVALTNCTFNDMSTFDFLTNSTVNGCVFRRCGQLTPAGADFQNNLVDSYVGTADTSALVWNVATNPAGLLNGCDFVMGATATHAIEFGLTSPTTLTLTDCTFTGYGADSTTSSAIHFLRTSGTVTVNYNGTKPTYKSAGATIAWVQSNDLTVNVDKDTTTEVRIYDNGTTTELDGIESIGATKTFTAAIDAATYPDVDVAILSEDYINERRVAVDMSAGDVIINIQQRIDRQYENP